MLPYVLVFSWIEPSFEPSTGDLSVSRNDTVNQQEYDVVMFWLQMLSLDWPAEATCCRF